MGTVTSKYELTMWNSGKTNREAGQMQEANDENMASLEGVVAFHFYFVEWNNSVNLPEPRTRYNKAAT